MVLLNTEFKLLMCLIFDKAFDKVWHDGLIFKLQENGI